ncbi:citrate lyase beta subunit [Ensifer sp. KUDG1]|uniref:hypothetical protein n=1 Tax=Ensifer sp. KUDG1 TaxID=3373919 RepID=UPI003D1B6FBD
MPAMIEDVGAVLEARAIARHERVLGLLTGGRDLTTRMGADPFPDVLVHLAAEAPP